MRIVSSVIFNFLKIRNFVYFEITLKDRVSLFYNHVINTLNANVRLVETKKVILNTTNVISLEFRSDRRINLIKQFLATKLNFTFVNAELFDNSKSNLKYFYTKSLRYLSHGSVGCALSVSPPPTPSINI